MRHIGKPYLFLIIFLLALILTLLVVLAIVTNRQPKIIVVEEPGTSETPVPSDPASTNLTIEKIEEKGNEAVVVTTNYCRLQFPYAFSDLIKVDVVVEDGKEILLFSALINGTKHRLYGLTFGEAGDMPVGALVFDGNEDAPLGVYANLYQPDETLTEDFKLTFVAAQETFNDIVVSLMENNDFVPAA